MASMEAESPLEAPTEERLGEILSGDDNVANTEETIQSATEEKTSPKSSQRKAVPPKRPINTSKRPTTSNPTSSTRPTATSTSRAAPSGGLSKPPARPAVTSSTRRPAANVTSSTASSTSHRPRPSISSIDEAKKGVTSSGEENKKPPISSTSKSSSQNSATPSSSTVSKPTSAVDRRSTLSSSTASGRKPGSSRTSISSPSKSALSPATNSARPTSMSTASRSTRPRPSSTRAAAGVPTSEPSRKRLSTIPASPAQPQNDQLVEPSDGLASPTTAKPTRPGLGTRKSTMSATIEQRLREMEIVNGMLQAAMAEDGEGDEETKEAYGKKAEEHLATLRSKLEEARRNEGKGPIESPLTQPASFEDSAKETAPTAEPQISDTTELQSALIESQEKAAALQAELDAVNLKLSSETEATELSLAQAKMATDVVQSDNAAKIESIAEAHAAELEALRSKLTEAESIRQREAEKSAGDLEDAKTSAANHESNETTRLIEEQKKAHEDALKLAEDKLERERNKNIEVSSQINQLEAELATLGGRLDGEQRRSVEEAENAKTQYLKHLEEKDRAIGTKDEDIASLHSKLEELQAARSSDVKAAESDASRKVEEAHSELAKLQTELSEWKANAEKATSEHDELLQKKDHEARGMSKVIDNLQEELQQLHESKDRDLDSQRVNLAKENESVVSKLRIEHEIALQDIQGQTTAESQSVLGDHEQKVQDLQQQHQTEKDELQKALDGLNAWKSEMEETLSTTRANHASEVENYQQKLAKAESEVEKAMHAQAEASDAAQTIQKNLATLGSERDALSQANDDLKKSFEDASQEIASLKKVLEAFDSESKDKDQVHTAAIKKMKDELEKSASRLQDKSQENSENLSTELEALRDGHAKELEEAKSSLQQQITAFKELEVNHDSLLKTWKEAESAHPAALEALKAEHSEAIGKHISSLEAAKDMHSKELGELQQQLEAEKRESKDTSEMQQEHERRYASLREELERASNVQLKSLQKNHEETLSELRSQSDQDRNAIAEKESELHEIREKGVKAQEEDQKLRAQLMQLEAETAKATEELRANVSELTKKHEAELLDLKETLRVEDEKREKERRQGAEVRDRLARELEALRREIPEANEQVSRHQKLLEMSKIEAHDANTKLATTLAALEDLKPRHQQNLRELDDLKVKAASNRSISMSTNTEPEFNEELEALQAIADAEREQNDKLKAQLQEALQAADLHATRVREVEAALKVTSAELTEMRTKRNSVSEFVASPPPKGGLRTSRWAAESEDGEARDDAEEGEDLGSSIEGTMAGLQQQIRQLEGVNEDMLDDAKRLVNMLSRASSSSPMEVDSPISTFT